jgi:hypothetical protein
MGRLVVIGRPALQGLITSERDHEVRAGWKSADLKRAVVA